MTIYGLPDIFAQLLQRFGLSVNSMPQCVGDITALRGVLRHLKNYFASHVISKTSIPLFLETLKTDLYLAAEFSGPLSLTSFRIFLIAAPRLRSPNNPVPLMNVSAPTREHSTHVV